jgi:20S proteasome subunit alpha 5
LTLREAQKIALSILKQVMEEKLTSTNIEMVTLLPDVDANGRPLGKLHRLGKEELDTLVAEL